MLYMGEAPQLDFAVLLFISAVTLAVLVFLWLAGGDDEGRVNWPAIAPAFFLGLSTLVLFEVPDFVATGGPARAAIILIAMVAAVLYRPRALALLHGAGVVTALAYMFLMPLDALLLDLSDGYLSMEGMAAAVAGPGALRVRPSSDGARTSHGRRPGACRPPARCGALRPNDRTRGETGRPRPSRSRSNGDCQRIRAVPVLPADKRARAALSMRVGHRRTRSAVALPTSCGPPRADPDNPVRR